MRCAAVATGLRLLAAAALAVGAASPGCTPACENEVILGSPSPDGAAIAFVFRRRCGAAPSTDVSVIDMHRTLKSGPGNVLTVSGDQAPKLLWRGPRQLEVSGFHPPIQVQNPKVGGVDILFRGAAADAAP